MIRNNNIDKPYKIVQIYWIVLFDYNVKIVYLMNALVQYPIIDHIQIEINKNLYYLSIVCFIVCPKHEVK
jgi:hypothetical protein